MSQSAELTSSQPESIKSKWIKALRSGVYKQGTYYLRNGEPNAYTLCCLGVCQDIQKPGGFDDFLETQSNFNGEYYQDILGVSNNVLEVPHYVDQNTESILACLNDGSQVFDPVTNTSLNSQRHKHSFDEIADWIEENLNDDLTRKIPSANVG